MLKKQANLKINNKVISNVSLWELVFNSKQYKMEDLEAMSDERLYETVEAYKQWRDSNTIKE
ncbi:hypothetical protein FDE94_09200 [Clostridium botulinum]|nr:hypothetical protein [Clostridium botulinum]NHI48043.1 hypothetical protein [Clostridium botulinum]